MKYHTLRLLPGQDLKREIVGFINQQKIEAGFICTCVGSLTHAELRYPYQHGQESTARDGEFEILALSGTLTVGLPDGCHIHATLSDEKGMAFGGHLQDGCLVCSTAEIVLCELQDVAYERSFDERTGFPELFIKQKG
ncbi:DNA-binding protein [Treponema sp.]